MSAFVLFSQGIIYLIKLIMTKSNFKKISSMTSSQLRHQKTSSK